MKTDEEIAGIVQKFAYQTFDNDLVAGIKATRDMDREGDPIFWVSICVLPEFMALPSRARLAFLTGLRSHLISVGEMAFPVIDYRLSMKGSAFNAEAA